jgi:hypothetical protein
MTTEFLLMVKIEKPISHVLAVAQGKQVITRVVFHTFDHIIIMMEITDSFLMVVGIINTGTVMAQ